ncbi:hypothetical protein P3T29_001599 [Kitasatospora sp. MAP5-34]|nr:hypothetical protein [Kitasatospora sp. MAP5-34]
MTRRWSRRRQEPPYTPPVPAGRWRGREHSLALVTAPESIPLARHTTQTAFTGRGVPPSSTVLGAALLIVTELVTNAVRHAAERSPATGLTVALSGGHLPTLVVRPGSWPATTRSRDPDPLHDGFELRGVAGLARRDEQSQGATARRSTISAWSPVRCATTTRRSSATTRRSPWPAISATGQSAPPGPPWAGQRVRPGRQGVR